MSKTWASDFTKEVKACAAIILVLGDDSCLFIPPPINVEVGLHLNCTMIRPYEDTEYKKGTVLRNIPWPMQLKVKQQKTKQLVTIFWPCLSVNFWCSQLPILVDITSNTSVEFNPSFDDIHELYMDKLIETKEYQESWMLRVHLPR